MLGTRQQKARYASDFYRDNYYRMLRWLLITSFLMLLLIGAIIYFILFNPPSHYYATTTQGQIIEMQTQSQ